jgi:colicin import membrane protein
MSPASERMEFAPPRAPGLIRALMLAVLAHAALLTVLTAGISWKSEAPQVTAQAELWSAIPQQAAPPAPLESPPEVAKVETKPEPKPEPQPPAAKPVDTPDPAIAIAKEKARKEKEKQQELEKQALEKQRLAKLAKDKQEKAKLEKEKLEKDKQAKLEKLAKDKANEKERDKALADAQKAKDANTNAEAKKLQELREQNLKRLAGLAGSGGSGDANSSGTAAQSSGPSAGYIGRIRARIKPNITYIETIVGNPSVEIEVRTSPDGTIISRRVVKPSGTASWDNAALNAIDKTAVLPRDENGKVPSSLIIVLSPQELIGR